MCVKRRSGVLRSTPRGFYPLTKCGIYERFGKNRERISPRCSIDRAERVRACIFASPHGSSTAAVARNSKSFVCSLSYLITFIKTLCRLHVYSATKSSFYKLNIPRGRNVNASKFIYYRLCRSDLPQLYVLGRIIRLPNSSPVLDYVRSKPIELRQSFQICKVHILDPFVRTIRKDRTQAKEGRHPLYSFYNSGNRHDQQLDIDEKT